MIPQNVGEKDTEADWATKECVPRSDTLILWKTEIYVEM